MSREEFPPYASDDAMIAATRADGRSRVRVYPFEGVAVVLGAGSRAEIELDLAACEADAVPILRRRGGGCAVVLDPGNIIVSTVIAGLPFGQVRRHFGVLTEWVIAGLAGIGVSGVRQAGICDLAIGDRKIGGACLQRQRDLLYYSVSLLVSPDISLVERYLRQPPREPDYRRGRSHTAFMGTIIEAWNGRGGGSRQEVMEEAARRLGERLDPPILGSE